MSSSNELLTEEMKHSDARTGSISIMVLNMSLTTCKTRWETVKYSRWEWNQTNVVCDVDVELMLSYGRWPDTLGEQRAGSKPAVYTQTADIAAATSTAAHRVSSTQWLTATDTVHTAQTYQTWEQQQHLKIITNQIKITESSYYIMQYIMGLKSSHVSWIKSSGFSVGQHSFNFSRNWTII